MSVKSSDLENRERGMSLSDRDDVRASVRGIDEVEETIRKVKGSKKGSDDAELKLIKERMETAAGLERPPDRAPHCGDCYKRGWHAAVKAIRDGVFP